MLIAAKGSAAPKKADPKTVKKAAPAKGAKAASAKEEKHGLFGSMTPLEVIGTQIAPYFGPLMCGRRPFRTGP